MKICGISSLKYSTVKVFALRHLNSIEDVPKMHQCLENGYGRKARMSGIPLELGPHLVKAKQIQKGKTIISLLSNASHFIEQWKVYHYTFR